MSPIASSMLYIDSRKGLVGPVIGSQRRISMEIGLGLYLLFASLAR